MQSLNWLAERNDKFKSLFNPDLESAFLSNRVYGSGDINFGRRNKVENGIFMIGDSAQVIAPLAGDGISMAMDSAKLLANLFHKKKQKIISDDDLVEMYNREWQNSFKRRLKTAYLIQKVLFNKMGRRIGLRGLEYFPNAINYLIRNTRG